MIRVSPEGLRFGLVKSKLEFQFSTKPEIPMYQSIFQILTTFIKEFEHNIPNTKLHDIQMVNDAVEFFNTEVSLSSALDDLTTIDLPRNLSIQTEYVRFDPDNKDDPITKGRTAFPGSDTKITSIKYKRKYDDIITTKPKPGYVNHYDGY